MTVRAVMREGCVGGVQLAKASSDVLSGEYGRMSEEADREEDDPGREGLMQTNSQGLDEAYEPGDTPKKAANKFALTREDLEKHFGYGLKDAARRLGVCNTTLKRACR